MVGSVGMGIGEASAVRLQTSGANGGVIFYAPLTGHLRVRQDDTTLDTREPNAWLLLTDQPADAQTGENLGVVVSLNKQRLQAIANIMLGLDAQAPTAVGNHSQALLLDTPQGVYAERNLPVLLHCAGEISGQWPDATDLAEDVVYRFVANLAQAHIPAQLLHLRREREHQLVDLACGYMLSQIDSPVKLTDVERMTGLSTRTLQYAFVKRFGFSPKAWLKEQRLQFARQMIASGGADRVSEAALASGLNHFGRFATDFRNRFGVSPAQLRRSSRA